MAVRCSRTRADEVIPDDRYTHCHKKRNKDDGERPFWISFSDLMTALMVVFLLVMSVALLAVTKDVSEQQRKEANE